MVSSGARVVGPKERAIGPGARAVGPEIRVVGLRGQAIGLGAPAAGLGGLGDGQRATVAGAGEVSRARFYSLILYKHWRKKKLYHSSTTNISDYLFSVSTLVIGVCTGAT